MPGTIKVTKFNKRNNAMDVCNNWTKSFDILNKDKLSIINPKFIISNASSPYNYNYLYWTDVDRYYFIDDIILLNSNTYEIQCSIDVLATYSSDINNYNGFCRRTSSSSYYNEDLEDGLVQPVNQVQTKKTSVATDFTEEGIVTFRVAGADSSGTNVDGYSQFAVSSGNLQNTMKLLMDISGLGQISQVADDLLNSQWQPFKYILSAKQLPISVETSQIVSVRVGVSPNLININNAKSIGDTVNGGRYWISNYNCSIPTPFHSDFRSTSPRFIQLQAYIPYIGLITIPPEYAKWDTLQVQYRVDLVTGDTVIRVTLHNGTYFNTIMIQQTNIASDIQLIGSSSSNIGTNLLGSIPVIGNLLSGGSGSVFAPNFDSVGNVGSVVGATTGLTSISIYLRSFASSAPPTSTKGRPSLATHTVSQFAGEYAEFLNPSVNPNGATKKEKDMINNYLANGIFVV